MKTQKQVAIKILKVGREHLAHASKEQALQCLHSEASILQTCAERKVQGVIKIKDCSFDGTLIKELSDEFSNSDEENSFEKVGRQLKNLSLSSSSEEGRILKRQHPVCYCVMSFVKYGELYRLVDLNQSMSDNLVKYLFRQLV